MNIPRPQPIGLLPFPVGHLLLPETDGCADVLEQLLKGDHHVEWPPAWRFYGCALRGETARACRLLAESDTPLARYNRFLLQPDADDYRRLCEETSGALGILLRAAGYAFGLDSDIPSPEQFDGELLAIVLAAQATMQIEKDAPYEALELLEKAIDAAREPSPLLAAILLNQRGELLLSVPGGSLSQAEDHFREALRIAGETRLPMLRAQLRINLGQTLQQAAEGNRAVLLEAVRCYQQALQAGVDREKCPRTYAMVHNNLGLAYMAMPTVEASDQLRMGIAVQSFRAALAVFRREEHPQYWASIQMNLANALQYLPSSHPAENLAQAVDAYHEVLRVRDKALDPLGYARTLLNQGNALAHLGAFREATEKLSEAYTLFHAHECKEEADTAKRLVAQIQDQRREENLEDQRSPDDSTTLTSPA